MSSSPDLTQPLPDPNWVMPSPAGEISLAIFGGAGALWVICCIYLSYRKRSLLPLIFTLAGAVSVMMEPIADTLGNVQHVPVNQINAFVTDGQPIPWAIALSYFWYFGSGPVLLWKYAQQRSMTPRRWYAVTFSVFLAVAVVEQIPIALGLWRYYGNQPLVVGLMPIDMAVSNTVAVMFPAMVMYAIWPLLTGRKQFLVLPLTPICVIGAHTAVGAPAYMLINAHPHAPSALVQMAGVITCAFAVFLVWFSAELVCGGFPELRSGWAWRPSTTVSTDVPDAISR